MKHTFEKVRLDQEKKAKEKKKNRSWRTFAGILLFAQAATSGYAYFRAHTLGMFPNKLLFTFGGVLVILLFLNYLLFFAGTKANAARTFRRFIAIVLSLAVCGGAVYAGNVMDKVYKTVKEITISDKADAAATMNVYVRYDDPAQNIEECKGYSFGVIGGYDGPASFAAVTKINSRLGTQVNASDFASIAEVADALLKNNVGAAVIEHNYVEILKETDQYSDFGDKARLIATIEITHDELTQAEASNPYSAAGTADKPVEIKTATGKVENVDLEPFIVYISGSDTREKMFTISRSDVNILMVVNPQTKQILLLNTPRDYFIPNPRSGSGTEDKLTHLGLYGVDCSITGLENLYDCDINYYIQINFTGVEKLVDDIGGVTIDNPRSFTSYNNPNYYYEEGVITLNGSEALAYARERYAFAEGDNMRGQNQMRLITAMFKKVTSSPTLIMNYKTILDDLDGYIVTNMEADEIDSLVRMQLNDFPTWNIQSYAVTGWGGMDTTYSAPWEELYVTYPYYSTVVQGQDLIDRVLDGEILTDEDVE